MFGKTLVCGWLAAALGTLALALIGAVSACVLAGTRLSSQPPAPGALTISPGYEWTDVSVQCWGGGVAAAAVGTSMVPAAAAGAGHTPIIPTRR